MVAKVTPKPLPGIFTLATRGLLVRTVRQDVGGLGVVGCPGTDGHGNPRLAHDLLPRQRRNRVPAGERVEGLLRGLGTRFSSLPLAAFGCSCPHPGDDEQEEYDAGAHERPLPYVVALVLEGTDRGNEKDPAERN